MSTLPLPQARIPLAWVTLRGERIPVIIDIEWMRALQGLLDRTGGTSGGDLEDIYDQVRTAPAAGVTVLQAPELGLGPAYEPVPFQDPLLPPCVPLQPDPDLRPVYEPLPTPESTNARIEALEATVAVLMRQINDLQQGYQL